MSDLKIYVFLIFLVVLTCSPSIGYSQSMSIDYNEISKIKEDTSEYFIGQLLGIDSDANGNIYLFDSFLNKVTRLNKSYKKDKEIVRSGRGPGEVNSIYSFYLNKKKGHILLADRQNMRLTIVDLDGDFINSIRMSPNDMNTPMNVTHYNSNTYAFLFSISPTQTLRREKGVDELFHMYDLNKESRIYSFGNREFIFDKLDYEGGAASQTEIHIGEVLFVKDNLLLYSPYVYNGTILTYSKKSDGSWKYNSELKGNKFDQPPFVDIGYNEYSSNKEEYMSGRNVFTTVGSIGKSAGYINRRSIGLYQLESGEIVNFYVVENGNEGTFNQDLYAEVFSSELKYTTSKNIFTGDEEEVIRNINEKGGDKFYIAIEGGRYKAYGIEFKLKIEKN